MIGNIAFEISPLLAASGLAGDMSGVYRNQYQLIKHISELLSKEKSYTKIYFFTINRNLLESINPGLYELLEKPNVKMLHVNSADKRASETYELFKKSMLFKTIRYFGRKIGLNTILNRQKEKFLERKYLDKLQVQLINHDVKLIHHSETGFANFENIKNVITVHDLIPFLFPKWQQEETIRIHTAKMNFINSYTDGITCISKNTKHDFQQMYPAYVKPNKVVYCGVTSMDNSSNAISFLEINEYLQSIGYGTVSAYKYFLFYSTLEPRKNIANLLLAFNEFILNNKGYKLIVIGGDGWAGVKKKLIAYLNSEYPYRKKSPIILLDFIADKYIATFIKNASAVVYPSFYEGFGLPVVEAMQYGTPVITSDTSSLPEVGGNVCSYIDPSDYHDISKSMSKVSKLDRRKPQISENLKKQARKFSWEKAARETIGFYKSLLT